MYIVISCKGSSKYILYTSLDKDRAKEYVIGYLKNRRKKNEKKRIEALKECREEYDIVASQIEANEKLNYYGCEELLKKLNHNWYDLGNQISQLQDLINVDYERDFDDLCYKYEIWIKEAELDKDIDICIDMLPYE